MLDLRPLREPVCVVLDAEQELDGDHALSYAREKVPVADERIVQAGLVADAGLCLSDRHHRAVNYLKLQMHS